MIGDSFTHATAVSDDLTYHALLAQLLDVEVFAYGAGGYGTLQELMILDRYIDIIRPDVILWQYCANDFINNDNELERLSLVNNNGWVRPYLQKGQVQLLSPKESSLQVREWINRRSRFLYFIVSRMVSPIGMMLRRWFLKPIIVGKMSTLRMVVIGMSGDINWQQRRSPVIFALK